MRELDELLEILQYLLDNHHPLNDIMYQNCGDEYYFHMYSGIGAPIHYAAAKGLLDTVELLVQRGASIETRDPSGQTAADLAERISSGNFPRGATHRMPCSLQMLLGVISELPPRRRLLQKPDSDWFSYLHDYSTKGWLVNSLEESKGLLASWRASMLCGD
jgi:hypothetical protein